MSRGSNKKQFDADKLIQKSVAILLTVVLAVILINDGIQNKQQEEEFSLIAQQQLQQLQAQKEAREQLRERDSFYQKLADGFDVRILVVGDSIGAGSGATDHKKTWAYLLANSLQNTYNIGVTFENVSMGGNTSYAGYVRTMALNDGVNYDLVVLCYGQNDGVNNFGLYYEALIRAVQNRFPKASVISVLESSQRSYTEKMQTIQALAKHYGIPVVDTIEPFQANYDLLASQDKVHPNDAGYTVYCEQILNLINTRVAERCGHDPENVAAVNEKVGVFDTFQWFGTEQFKREGNTYTLTTKTEGIILGIDYTIKPGNNDCRILIDGVEYAAPQTTFSYDFSQRRILVVNNWMAEGSLNICEEIKIIFAEDKAGTSQADGFQGIAISG